jgi:hypothetical protein
MDICIGRKYKSLLLIATSQKDEDKLLEIVNQSDSEEIKRSRSLSTVISGRLYHAQSVEESSF